MPSSEDLQLSDSLRHDFSTILLMKCEFCDLLNINRATSLSVEEWLIVEKKERKTKRKDGRGGLSTCTLPHFWGPGEAR